jgi:hypothetical protein
MPVITGGATAVTFVVEVCFNQMPNDPAAPTAVWTDITQRCSNIRWSRGRQYELDKVETGTFSANVDNLDGALTPGNTASAFYPNVVLYRQIRVTATVASTTYTLFYGYVSRWPQAYTQAGQRASTSIEAVDALGVLAQVNLNGWGNDALGAYSPTVVYPLDDGANATLFNASVGTTSPGTILTTPSLGTPQVVSGQNFDESMPGFSGRTYTSLTNATVTASPGSSIMLPTSLPAAGAWSVSMWVRFNTLPTGQPTFLYISDADAGQGITGRPYTQQVLLSGVTGGGALSIAYQADDTVSAAHGGSVVSAAVGKWHLVTLSLSADHRTLRFVLDQQAPITVCSIPSGTPMQFDRMTFVQLSGANLNMTALANVDLANFAIFPTDLAGDTVNNPCQTVLYPAGVTAFASETTDLRAKRIAAATGFGSRFVSTGTGDSTMSAGATAGQTATDALGDVAATEFGMIFARGDGMLVSTPRHARYNPNPTYFFGELELPYSALSFDYDPTHLVNSATVSRPGGSTVTVTDATSVKANFTHSQSYALQLSSDIPVRGAAEWLVSRYKDPKMRVSAFSVNPLANSDLVNAVLNLELNACVQLNRRPPGVQAIAQTCFVDRLEHQLTFDSSGGSWTVSYMLTPAETTGYLVWDAPGAYGKWDSNNWAY